MSKSSQADFKQSNRPEHISNLRAELTSTANMTANAFTDTRAEVTTQSAQIQMMQANTTMANNTGLPDDLKSGMESLSGMNLDHVRVHYNSSKPAAVQANAYAQGADIHLGTGQEKHLPHELGHVVQQMQGRVKPTTSIDGVAVNDNAGLELEATRMGEQALQRAAKTNNASDNRDAHVSAAPHSHAGIVQCSKIISHDAKKEESPLGALARQLPGINDFFLSPTDASRIMYRNDPDYSVSRDRPKSVKAEIQGARRPVGGRDPNSLTAIIGNLGNEELLIAHGARGQLYEGGHLIGDQLLPTTIDSFTEWNLAPQNADFNAPIYEQIVEAEIAAGSVNTFGQRNKNDAITLTVTLSYQSDNVTVTADDLVTRGVVRQADMDAEVDPMDQTTTNITFPRRVPSKWELKVDLDFSSTDKLPAHKLTDNQKKAYNTNITDAVGPLDYYINSDSLTQDPISKDYYIGGGKSYTLTGIQGEPTAANTTSSRSGKVSMPAAPAPVKQAYLNAQYDLNQEIKDTGNGTLSLAAQKKISDSPAYTKSFANALSDAIWAYCRSKGKIVAFANVAELIHALERTGKIKGTNIGYARKFIDDANLVIKPPV
ncbi:eCIS core domain-containing protein [Pseudoalteromonas sp. S16_S37]|uniref:eCIS core domain-containing protein n=1 Tax=Pseudoalteromonas sp. S16_S37 TaxID=2720228 RepID=UPI001EEF6DED|nr:DUF4157 domain-containing protein [Pseudoalteromonas sp. S16_S37]